MSPAHPRSRAARRARALALALFVPFAAACGSDDPSSDPSTDSPSESSATNPDATSATAPPATAADATVDATVDVSVDATVDEFDDEPDSTIDPDADAATTTEPVVDTTVNAGPGSTTGSNGDDPDGDGGDCPAADGSSPRTERFTEAPAQCIEDGVDYAAVVTTNHGTFTIDLAEETSPITVNNFVALAGHHYYDGTECHRVIAGFVVQCGRPDGDESAPGYTIPDELPAQGEYAEGVVAMANTGRPNTGGGQWFVITGPNGASLPPLYSIVGRVSEGYETTVKALEALADPAAPNGVPTLEPIEISSIEIVQG